MAFVGLLALLAAIASGGLQRAADWAGQQLVTVVAIRNLPLEPEGSRQIDRALGRRKRQQRQGQG